MLFYLNFNIVTIEFWIYMSCPLSCTCWNYFNCVLQVCLHCLGFWSDRKWKNTHNDWSPTAGTGNHGIHITMSWFLFKIPHPDITWFMPLIVQCWCKCIFQSWVSFILQMKYTCIHMLLLPVLVCWFKILKGKYM